MPSDQRDERYQPLALISITLVALLGFAVFFLSFLVAPLAILAIFYVGFAASDRSKRSNGNGRAAPGPAGVGEEPATTKRIGGNEAPRTSAALLAREAQARQNVIERAESEQRRVV